MKRHQNYTVELTNFAGPLDLLLSLIERRELEVTEVAVSQVTADYLRTVSGLEAVDERELFWFLDIATRLLHYKSKALRQSDSPVEADEAEGDLASLTEQLRRLKTIRQAARELAGRWQVVPSGQGDSRLQASLPPLNLRLQSLTDAWLAISSRQRDARTVARHQVTIVKLDLQAAGQKLLGRLQSQLAFSTLVKSKSRRDRVETLLALLELIKQDLVSLLSEGEEMYAQAA